MIKIADGLVVSETEYIRLATEFVEKIAQENINTDELEYRVEYHYEDYVGLAGSKVELTMSYKNRHFGVGFTAESLFTDSAKDMVVSFIEKGACVIAVGEFLKHDRCCTRSEC